MDLHVVGYAFALTLFAGLATGVGSAMAFFTKRTNTRFLAIALGFSAGVMIYVSFVEILAKAIAALTTVYGPTEGRLYAVLSFFLGILIIGVIDRLVPSYENPHENMSVEVLEDPLRGEEYKKRNRLLRIGLVTALAIGSHNFPEGLATFVSAIEDPRLGLLVVIPFWTRRTGWSDYWVSAAHAVYGANCDGRSFWCRCGSHGVHLA